MTDDDREAMISDGLTTVAKAASFLSVGRSTIYALMERGALPYCKINRSRRIPWQAIRQLAAGTLRNGDSHNNQ